MGGFWRSRTSGYRSIGFAGLFGLLLLSASVQAPSPLGPPASPEPVGVAAELQSVDERQMALLFKVFLDMDRREGLALDAKQAGRMLPLIEKSGNRGALSTGDFQRLVELMTPPQKAFCEQILERVRLIRQALRESGTEPGKKLSSEEMRKLVERFEQRRASSGGRESDPGVWKSSRQDSPLVRGRSLERQLIDLLRERAGLPAYGDGR